MDVYRPLGAGLFFYDCLRLLLLVVFLLMASVGGSISGPFPVYMSSNALFPLMTLFIWLKPGEYRNYIALYTAGKIIALVLFFIWEIFTFSELIRFNIQEKSVIILTIGALLSVADILSVWGVLVINRKFRRVMALENGGE
jgi:hypothetical protein